MDIPTLVSEIRHQLGLAPIRFRGVVEVILMKECFAPGGPPVRVTSENIVDFKLRQANMGCFSPRLPLVVPRDQMFDFCHRVETALWHSLAADPLWIVRDLALNVKAEGRIVAKTEPTPVAFLVDDIRMESSARRWTVRHVAFCLVHVAAVGRKLVPELLDEWEDRPPGWVELDTSGSS